MRAKPVLASAPAVRPAGVFARALQALRSARRRHLGPACLAALVACAPAPAAAQTQSIYSNLANPSIGMNALFSGQAARTLNQPYGLQFDEAEISLISVVDPYWTFSSNIVFAPDGVDPEEVWARSTSTPGIGLKLGKLRGTFGRHGLLHYGQQHIMTSGSGNSVHLTAVPRSFFA